MIVTIEKSSIRGIVDAPPSKSVAQRLILATLLSKPGTITLRRIPKCGDVLSSLNFVKSTNVEYYEDNGVYIFKIPEELELKKNIIDLGDSGTTYRIAIGLASTFREAVVLECGRSMRRRPISDLVEALKKLGAQIQYIEEPGYPPVRVRGPLKGGKVSIRGDISSQYISSLIYAGIRSEDGIEINVKPPIVSKPYMLLTVKLLKNLGADVDIEGDEEEGYTIFSYPSDIDTFNLEVPGDYALSAFIMSIAAVCGEEVVIRGFNDYLNSVDIEILQYFKDMNINVKKIGDLVYVSYSDNIEPCDLDLHDNPDLVMPIVAVASFSNGKSIIRNVKHLIHKESNRLREISRTLREFNIKTNIDEERGYIEIVPGRDYKAANIDLPDDHRIAMMCSVIACRVDGVTVLRNAECVNKSWPEYWNILRKLGVRLEIH